MNLPPLISSDVGTLPDTGLSDAEHETIRVLGQNLSADRALWVSGYFAGIADLKRSGAGQAGRASGVPDMLSGSPDNAPATTKIKILYGSETGNAAALARDLLERFTGHGVTVEAMDLAAYKVRDLKKEERLLFIVSTHGEGDPAEPALPFFEFLAGPRAPSLEGLSYAVLALGDSTYEFFCEAGKRLDQRLAELGATRMRERCDCDVDYEADSLAWSDKLLDDLGSSASAPAIAMPGAAAPLSGAKHDKRNPFTASILENVCITGRGSSKKIQHIELDIEGSGLTYQPGDALGVLACNEPRLVEEVLTCLNWTGKEAVVEEGVDTRTFLSRRAEITALTPKFLSMWATLTGRDDLQVLLDKQDRKELARYMGSRHVIDVLLEGGADSVAPEEFTAGLRRLQPRLYSIASSCVLNPDEVHLCVSPVSYDMNGRRRLGVASTDLAVRRGVGENCEVYIQENTHFRLPEDPEAPIIMIGAGTGIAPYRAFMQEREALGLRGKAWLFFGERQFRTDFLYQTEWQAWLKDGTLSQIDLAFSRDQARKIYVQHRIKEKAAEIHRWIEDGAHIYVCGDATHMAEDVNDALLHVLSTEGRVSDEDARKRLTDLQVSGRYQRDVY